MSKFEVKVYPITLMPHENAHSLELAIVGAYKAVVGKGLYKDGDLIAYIPEGSILPSPLLEEMEMTGKLSGPEKNRVKAVKLRGVLSQGVCYPARAGWKVGQDVAEELGVTKWEPVVPAGFQGELQSVGNRTIKYDIENWKKFPNVLQDGEPVVFTEKLHGTFAMFGVMNAAMALESEDFNEARLIIASKGVAAKGLAFKPNAEANKNNIYVRTAKTIDFGKIQSVFGDTCVYVLGEIFGKGVQDLAYGLDRPEFRVFDIYVGSPGEGKFLSDQELEEACQKIGIPRVPVLYRGPFSKEVMEEYTNGRETISGKNANVREGIVMRPQVERQVEDLPCEGRVQLKNVSEGYLLRKGEITEFN